MERRGYGTVQGIEIQGRVPAISFLQRAFRLLQSQPDFPLSLNVTSTR